MDNEGLVTTTLGLQLSGCVRVWVGVCECNVYTCVSLCAAGVLGTSFKRKALPNDYTTHVSLDLYLCYIG